MCTVYPHDWIGNTYIKSLLYFWITLFCVVLCDGCLLFLLCIGNICTVGDHERAACIAQNWCCHILQYRDVWKRKATCTCMINTVTKCIGRASFPTWPLQFDPKGLFHIQTPPTYTLSSTVSTCRYTCLFHDSLVWIQRLQVSQHTMGLSLALLRYTFKHTGQK